MYKRVIVAYHDENVHPPPTSAIIWINTYSLPKNNKTKIIAPNKWPDQGEVTFEGGISERRPKSDRVVLGYFLFAGLYIYL